MREVGGRMSEGGREDVRGREGGREGGGMGVGRRWRWREGSE